MFRECVNVYTVCMYITYMFRECVNVYHDHVHVYCMSKLTIFKSVLDNVVPSPLEQATMPVVVLLGEGSWYLFFKIMG